MQRHPWPLAIVSLAVMVALVTPVLALRLDESDAGNNPSSLSSRHAFDLLAQGFGQGFNGPLLLVAELSSHGQAGAVDPQGRRRRNAGRRYRHPAADLAVRQRGRLAGLSELGAPGAGDQRTRQPPPPRPCCLRWSAATGTAILVGGFTAGSIDFSNYLANKLPLFFGLVILLSALLLLLVFRSIVIPVQAAILNLLTVGAALGVTVAVFQWGWLGGLLGVQKGPIEAWVPVIMFAVVFGLSMDYEVFLVSRIREQWLMRRDASSAVAEGVSLTGRVITAAAAIMVCVFLSFVLGDERTLKEFGFALAVAVFLDALVVRCMLLPASLELIGPITWSLPGWLESRLPLINIEGTQTPPPDPVESGVPEPPADPIPAPAGA